jgi:hypothetical protein
MSESERIDQNRNGEYQGEMNASQPNDSNITDETELQAQRDKDARETERKLQHERDTYLRNVIDSTIKEIKSQISEKVFADAKTTTADAIKTLRTEVLATFQRQQADIEAKATSIFEDVESNIKQKANDLINTTIDKTKTDIKRRIEQVVTTVQEQENRALKSRDTEAKYAEILARAERDRAYKEQADKNNTIVSILKDSVEAQSKAMVLRMSSSLQTVKNIQAANADMFNSWINAFNVKPGRENNVETFFNLIQTQQELFTNATQILLRTYSNTLLPSKEKIEK